MFLFNARTVGSAEFLFVMGILVSHEANNWSTATGCIVLPPAVLAKYYTS